MKKFFEIIKEAIISQIIQSLRVIAVRACPYFWKIKKITKSSLENIKNAKKT
jgi:hypothetical protein